MNAILDDTGIPRQPYGGQPPKESNVPFPLVQTSQTAPAPPIPPLPTAPGAATGGAASGAQTTVGTAPEDIQRAVENAIQASENAVNAANQSGQPVILQPPPTVYRVDPDIPPEVVPIIGIIFGSIAFMVVVSPIVRGIMKFIERRQDQNLVHGPSVANQLLQQSVDALAIEVERISESQRFIAKLSAEKDKAALPSGRGGA